jgi:hypothetical protein
LGGKKPAATDSALAPQNLVASDPEPFRAALRRVTVVDRYCTMKSRLSPTQKGQKSSLYNVVPYQRRATHAGQCGVEVDGGGLPTTDWLLNLQILTSGGLQCADETFHH